VRKLFQAPAEQAPPVSQPAAETQVAEDVAKEEAGSTVDVHGHEEVVAPTHDETDLTEVWHKMELLNEELARAIHERDQAMNEVMVCVKNFARPMKPARPRKAWGLPLRSCHW